MAATLVVATCTLALTILGFIAAVCAILVAIAYPELRDAMRAVLSTMKCFMYAAISSNYWAACTAH